jgi:hypothetical protein
MDSHSAARDSEIEAHGSDVLLAGPSPRSAEPRIPSLACSRRTKLNSRACHTLLSTPIFNTGFTAKSEKGPIMVRRESAFGEGIPRWGQSNCCAVLTSNDSLRELFLSS